MIIKLKCLISNALTLANVAVFEWLVCCLLANM